MTALRKTGFAVQSVQDADSHTGKYVHTVSDLKKCRRNRRIPHVLIHAVVVQGSVFRIKMNVREIDSLRDQCTMSY
jgi:hypothetical protein